MARADIEEGGGKPGVALAPEQSLRLLIVNENDEQVAFLTAIVEEIGHRVVARATTLDNVAATTREELPDVALVGAGEDPDHALAIISRIVKEAACPVVALLQFADPTYVNEAARRGIFAYVLANGDYAGLQTALDITLRRFAEYHNLEGAFARRAIIEQAKGILMERHRITGDEAFELLRRESTNTGRKLIDIARAVTECYRLLPDNAPKTF